MSEEVGKNESTFRRTRYRFIVVLGSLAFTLLLINLFCIPRSEVHCSGVEKMAILLILPDDIYNDMDHEYDFRRAQECWIKNCEVDESDNPSGRILKWALGSVLWREISLRKGAKLKEDVHVFLLRYSKSLSHGEVTQHSAGEIVSVLTFGRMPDSWDGTVQTTHPILYKTIEALRFLLKQGEYGYFVRGNINIFLDVEKLRDVLNFLPKKRLYTSPFLSNKDYIIGYFILMSADVASGITKNFDRGTLQNLRIYMNKEHNTSLSAETADDVDLAVLSLGKMYGHTFGKAYAWPLEYQTMMGGDSIHNPRSLSNYLGLRLDDDLGHRGFLLSYDEAIQLIKNASDTVFLYRMRTFRDKSLVRIYKYLLDFVDLRSSTIQTSKSTVLPSDIFVSKTNSNAEFMKTLADK